jgi:glutaredoxin
MKQQCHIAFVYVSWVILVGGFIFHLWRGNIVEAVIWIPLIVLLMWIYIRKFPSLSSLMGYGSVADKPASSVQPSSADVVLYTGVGCPFCPIVKARLQALQSQMGFRLKEIDVTFRPELLIAKGIKALPVVEVGDTRRVGNGTSEEIAAFIASNAGRPQA